MYIINRTPQPNNFGNTRSQAEKNLRKEWGSTMTDEQLEKCKHAEKKMKHCHSKKNFLPGHHIDEVK